jgi:YcaO-like protein with predicted kinase domain
MIVFSRVYNCKQCKKIENNTLDIIDNGKDVFSGNNPIIYTKGGARSATYSFSKKMLDRAISESKIKIEVEEIKENELRDVIPSFQATAHLDSEDYITYGKGINPRQAYLSAGYEMVERLSARDYMSKEIVKYSPGNLTECLLDIKDKVNSAIELGLSYDEYDNNKEMDCVWGKSLLTGRKKLVPASFTFLTNTFFEGNYMNNGSSGLAAGAKIEDAILQALMEVIEHDAMIIGQCIKKRKPIVDYNRIPPDIKDVIIKIEKRGFKIVSRDYTNDIGIPVMVTWIWRENRCFDFASRGLGCSIYPMVALERSITEAVQTATAFDNDVVLDYSKKNYLNLYNNPGSLFNLSHFLEYEINEDGVIVDINKYTPNEKILTIEEYFDEVKKRIVNALGDTDIVYVDLTSHMFNIPVVKVIITKGIQELGEPPIITTDRLGKNGISGSAIEKYKGLYCGRFPH